MVKGGKRYYSIRTDVKWFAHPGSTEKELQSRETCTNTGIMLTQVKSSLPQAFDFKRYPKCEPDKRPRQYPFSNHDNRLAFKDIFVFTDTVGRKKCLDDRRQHNSHFCLCSDIDTRPNYSLQQTDYRGAQTDVITTNRRFPRDHRQKSAEAAQPGEPFMWFGRV